MRKLTLDSGVREFKMTLDERIQELKQKACRLNSLLDDPHPGLATWMIAVGRAIDDIAEHAPSYEKAK